jgi:SpoVK/Ycf46/Vps4 family AAA+-type ATPase
LVELKKPTTLSGRAEIFKLHCKKMRQSGRLKLHSSNSDSAYGQWLLSLASQTDGFSGAMIAGVVRAAAVLSLERAHESKRGSSAESCVAALKNCQVTAGDFETALVDIARSWLHHDSSEDNSTREAEGSKISRKTPPAARVPTQFVASKAKMDAEKVVENEVSSSALVGAVLPEIKTKMEATGWQHWSEDAIKRVALKRDEEARVELRPPKETATETSSNEARTSMRSPSPESRHDSKDEGSNDALKRAAVKSALSDVKERMSSTGWFHWSSSSIQKVVEKRKLSVVESQDGSAMPIEKTESMFRQEASRDLGEEEEINMSSFAKAVQQARKDHRQGG